MTRILVVDDHVLVRRGLRSIMEGAFLDLELVEAEDASRALEVAAKVPCDLALVDINLPGRNGLDLLQDLRRLYPKMPVIILTAFAEGDYGLRAYKLGASGYVSKQSAETELLRAIRRALTGGIYVTPSLAGTFASVLAGNAPDAPHESLSNRELRVLCSVARGKTLKEIAAELNLSEKTIGTYRTRISQKLGISTNVELARYAERNRLVD